MNRPLKINRFFPDRGNRPGAWVLGVLMWILLLPAFFLPGLLLWPLLKGGRPGQVATAALVLLIYVSLARRLLRR